VLKNSGVLLSQELPETAEQMQVMKWLKPKIVAQVRFMKWIAEGSWRHTAFRRVRGETRRTT
jgi:hypothetical protein